MPRGDLWGHVKSKGRPLVTFSKLYPLPDVAKGSPRRTSCSHANGAMRLLEKTERVASVFAMAERGLARRSVEAQVAWWGPWGRNQSAFPRPLRSDRGV